MIGPRKRRVSLCLMVALVPAGVYAQTTTEMDPAAREYLERALDIMETESMNRATVDWPRVRAEAYGIAGSAATPSDTYPAISTALSALGDNHSRLIVPLSTLPQEVQRLMTAQSPPAPDGRRLSFTVGYIRVPGFSGPNPEVFANEILELVRELDAPAVCGWVVDLRGNGGGNMWPMLQGLSPILGVGIPGYFVPPEGPWEPWMINRAPVGTLALTPPFRAVAVLHDSVTASSGEAVAVAFRGRQQARSFGQSTRGLSTANRSIPLGDGAVMALTVSIFADRRQNTYGGPISPDEPIPLGTPDEEVLGWASEWLSGQPSCASR